MTDSAHFVWTDLDNDGRNRFALFRRELALTAVPDQALLHLFADTRYRLWVNGSVVGYGPARFSPTRPEYDSHDLAPWLSTGANVILVEVNHRGANAFDAAPSKAGFIAWGHIANQDLATPGAWRSREAEAWDGKAPCFSFAQGPIEICDTRLLDPAWYAAGPAQAGWQAPVAVDATAWGAREPRSIPLMDMAEREPIRVDLVATLAVESRIGYREDGPRSGAGTPRAKGGLKRRTVYATCLHSPREQDVTLGLFWGPHFCNGEELKPTNHPLLGNRQQATVRLKAGWNLLYGEPEVMTDAWPVLIALPDGAELTASSEERREAPACMLRAGPFTDEELAARRPRPPRNHAELPDLGWRPVGRDERPMIPSRQAGWDRPDSVIPHPAHVTRDLTLDTRTDTVVIYDLDGEFHGHAVVEIDAPAGTELDIAIAERKRSDGLLALFLTHWITNESERFVLRGGRQRIEGFHPRGGRYVALFIRGASGPVRIRRVAVRDTLYPQPAIGRFTASDPLWSWLWTAGAATLRACMEDGFVDCPWRERGCYVGDSLVQFHAARMLDADLALVRRCLRVFADCQPEDGLIQDTAPSWMRSALIDYSLVWIMCVREVWAVEGDLAWVRSLWPNLCRVLASSSLHLDTDGLVVAQKGQRVFLDWGVPRLAREGKGGPLNAFYAKALADATELAQHLGAPEAGEYATRRDRAVTGFRAAFWEAEKQAFRDVVADHPPVPGRGLHTNALALAFDLVPAGGEAGVLRLLAADDPVTGNRDEGLLDTYAFSYLLDGLARVGETELAERLTRSAYEPMRAGGAWTLWENFHGSNSLCHAWSCSPMRFAIERILGVRAERPGEPDRIVIAPSSTLLAAEGIAPHRRGPIAVAWHVDGELLHLRIRHPPGVTIAAIRPEGPLAGKRVALDLAPA